MSDQPVESPSSRFRMPHTLVIVGVLVVIVLAMSWLIPSGTYDRVEKGGRLVTVPDTYEQVLESQYVRRNDKLQT